MVIKIKDIIEDYPKMKTFQERKTIQKRKDGPENEVDTNMKTIPKMEDDSKNCETHYSRER